MKQDKIKVDQWSLADIVMELTKGKIRIPRFQRDFVWDRKSIQTLLDSMYKEYPIGTLFLWEAPSQYNHLLRNVEDLQQPTWNNDQSYTLILDGQQRMTSLYATVKGLSVNGEDYSKIVVDLASFGSDKLPFQYRIPDNKRWVSVSDLLSESIFGIYNGLPNDDHKKAFEEYRNALKNYPFSVVIVKSMEIEDAIEIFERINRQGRRLTRYDLITANVMSDDFDLRERARVDVIQPLDDGYGSIPETNIPQSLAINIHGSTEYSKQISLTNEEVKTNWDRTVECLKLAIEFMRSNLGVARMDFLPYDAMVPVLAYYFFYGKVNDVKSTDHVEKLKRWFWRVAFSERYTSASQTRMTEDATWIRNLIDNDAEFPHGINTDIDALIRGSMRATGSAVRNGILCLLNLQKPRHFTNGSDIQINTEYFAKFTIKERHRIVSYAPLKQQVMENRVNSLANFAFIPEEFSQEQLLASELMRAIRDKLNDDYEFDRIMRTHLIPVADDSGIWQDDYELFLRQRAALLLEEVRHLCGIAPKIEQDNTNPLIDLIETAMRDNIHVILSNEFGHDYWKQGIRSVSGDIDKAVMGRIDAEIQKTPGLSRSDFDNLRKRLDYLDVSDYVRLITNKSHWRYFSSTFKHQNECKRYLNDFREYRNAVKHNRKLDSVLEHSGTAAILWLAKALDVDLSQYGL